MVYRMTVKVAKSEAGDSRRTWIDALYRKYHQALRKFLARQRLKPDEVADIVQEAYFRMHQVGNANSIANPKAYLFRVAHNIRFNERKLHRNGIQEDVLDIDSVDIESDEPGPHRRLQGEQEFAIVCAALEELPPRCREAFVMNRFRNMSFREIAVELDLSASMIEKHVSHAISHMRKRLNDDRPSQAIKTIHETTHSTRLVK